MQTFTIFFGVAVIAIAIENFTANFHLVKSNDARTKGHQGMQSRVGKGYRYFLRGYTGTEKVIIRDGNKTPETRQLKKTNQEFFATNRIITIEYTNDHCCEPEDKNVIFTPDYPYKISTKDNKNNYFENWNCSACETSPSPKKRNQMDLQSRAKPREKPDECYKTREDDATDCLKCALVNDGQFCYPGNYTLEFESEDQCHDVTFSECGIPDTKYVEWDDTLVDEPGRTALSQCNQMCFQSQKCQFYRFNYQTRNCTFYDDRYKGQYCNIFAAPGGKSPKECLFVEEKHICDSIVDEECEYDGELLRKHLPGDILTAEVCNDQCEMRGTTCKYWIFKHQQNECILKRDGKKKCNVKSGQKMSVNDFKFCMKSFHKVE